jgi:hypothetical protein
MYPPSNWTVVAHIALYVGCLFFRLRCGSTGEEALMDDDRQDFDSGKLCSSAAVHGKVEKRERKEKRSRRAARSRAQSGRADLVDPKRAERDGKARAEAVRGGRK